MVLTFWPLALVWVLVLGGGAWLLRRRLRRGDEQPAEGLAAAHTARIKQTSRYRALAREHWRWTLIQVIAVGLIATGTVLLTTRLATAGSERPEQRNRDIMLCLDTSDSMAGVDAGILAAFAEVAKELEGERIGLTIWNASAVTVFPLTDDYPFIVEQLERSSRALEEMDFDFTSGTTTGPGYSLVGDGLASCLQRFDRPAEHRSRSLVFATDNKVSGEPVFTLAEAAGLAIDSEVRVYGIAPPYGLDGEKGQEMKRELERTGGTTRSLDDPALAGEMVAQIQAEETARIEGSPRRIVTDRPLVGLVLAGLGLLGLAVSGWRTRQ